jgi:hypothetical protein
MVREAILKRFCLRNPSKRKLSRVYSQSKDMKECHRELVRKYTTPHRA